MDRPWEGHDRRFSFVTAAHHFLLSVLPLREPASRHALRDFVCRIATSGLVAAEVDAVLLRLLFVLDPHTGGRLPSLVDRYLAAGRTDAAGEKQFRECVEDVLTYRGIHSAHVQQAIAIIERQYADPQLTQRRVAHDVGLAPGELAVRFKGQTALTFGEYLRQVRLSQSATLLAGTHKRIKEIWTTIGYNHGSNFDHDFKRVFGITPREYRGRVLRPDIISDVKGPATHQRQNSFKAPGQTTVRAPAPGLTVLIVDDDLTTTETIAQYLTLEGYQSVVASTGEEGLRAADGCAPAAILLDYHLPDIDGLECLRRLRRRNVIRPPGVVVFTADWEVERNSAEIHALRATIASKLCDLDEIGRLIAAASDPQFGSIAPCG
jgi:AraC-like DNA-binding protein/CheY-like chemotaxis protein